MNGRLEVRARRATLATPLLVLGGLGPARAAAEDLPIVAVFNIESKGARLGRAAMDRLGGYLTTRLEQLRAAYPAIGDVRGPGLMVATEFTRPDGRPDPAAASAALSGAASRGLLMLGCGPYGNIVRWVPPLVVGREQIDEAVETFTQAVEQAPA